MREIRSLCGEAFLRFVTRLGVAIDRSPDETRVMGLARIHKLTVYDAAYLELAQRSGFALASLDRELIRAAKAEGVGLVG